WKYKEIDFKKDYKTNKYKIKDGVDPYFKYNCITLYVLYKESIINDSENEGYYERSYNFNIEDIVSVKPKNNWYIETINMELNKIPDRVYVVVARYSSENTFGTSSGHGHIIGCYLTRNEAEEIKISIE